jgi:uncharacterized surface protein with fasciclin (FAS1) repeats
MRKVALLAAAGVMSIAPAGALAGSSGSATAQEKNLVQVAGADKRFSTLVSLVKEAGLVGVLSGNQKLTVLAPTNAAFSKVPKATLSALREDPDQLRAVLTYHVLRGSVTSDRVVKLRAARTLQGSGVRIRVTGGKVKINDATVTTPDVMASNGVIHVIDRVLIPPR